MVKVYRILPYFFILFILTGCGTVKETKVRVYAVDKPRVDQQVDGNAGYLVGGQPVDAASPSKDTRKIYVMEFTAPAPEVPDIKKTIEEEITITPPVSGAPSVIREQPQETAPVRSTPRKIEIPKIEGAEPAPSAMAPGGQYVIEKDDTLQKISKKFYGTYSKWHKIYEANKDVIKNPDLLVPGTRIIIPTE